VDNGADQVGWTEAQWNRIRGEVLRAWQSVRVAGSFLPVYGPLPPSTQVVPSEIIKANGTVDERSIAPLLEISLPVVLSRQQVREEDLSSALLQFKRRAAQLAQLEDWFIFNGAYAFDYDASSKKLDGSGPWPYRPDYPFLRNIPIADLLAGAPEPIADHSTQQDGLAMRNPGVLGLIEGPRSVDESQPRGSRTSSLGLKISKPLDFRSLVDATVDAIGQLERNGYVAPYACAYGRRLFRAANEPVGTSVTSARDRLEPLIGREILHAGPIGIPPEGYAELAPKWQNRGVLLSLAGDPVDLAMVSDAEPEYRFVDERGRYVFSVFERFALRIKDPLAIVPLTFPA
jgi:uncharacterized linocin/CFP29 family protein